MVGLAATEAATQGTTPELTVVAISGVLALVLATVLWPLAGYAVTIAHEGGHALTTIAVGSRVDGVVIKANRTGETASDPSIHQADHTWVLMTGYVAPPAFGYLAALVLAHGRPDVVLWTSLVLLALLFTAGENWFGRLAMVATGAVLLIAVRRGSDGTQALVACTWTWLLLFGGVRAVLAHGTRAADYDVLRQRTLIPRAVWFGLSLVGSLAALVAGGAVLVGAVQAPV